MPHTEEPRMISLADALQAQKALRQAAGLGDEEFPLPAFVGMVSDEIEALRNSGSTDDQIAELIERSSAIRIAGEDLTRYYATPEQRNSGNPAQGS